MLSQVCMNCVFERLIAPVLLTFVVCLSAIDGKEAETEWMSSQVSYDDEAYRLELAGDAMNVSVLKGDVGSEFIDFELNPVEGESLPVLVFAAKIGGRRARLKFEVASGSGKQFVREVILRDGDKEHAYSVELDDESMSAPARVRLRIAPMRYGNKPAANELMPSCLISQLRLGSIVEAEEAMGALEQALAVGRKLAGRASTGEGEGEYSPLSLDELSGAIHHGERVLKALKTDFDYVDSRYATRDFYDKVIRFERSVSSAYGGLVDERATRETRYLFENLKRTGPDRFYFGMHDATGYGVGWRGDDNRSDINDVSGDFPAIFSWDVMLLTYMNQSESLKYRIESAYRKGGVNTLCWHQFDPLGYGFYGNIIPEGSYENSVVASLLEGGEHHEFYLEKLRDMARFLKELRGPDGESIPILFRPLHEMNGDWFWWGRDNCSVEDFVALWRLTVRYLRDELNVHNLIYVYSPDAGQYEPGDEFFDYYPGDEYVDALGFDSYWNNSEDAFKNRFIEQAKHLSISARERGMFALLTEVGDRWDKENGGERLATTDWFTRCLLDSILTDEDTRNIVGAVTWRNDNPSHHFNPYPGHPSVEDFLEFYEHPITKFLREVPPLYETPQ